VKKSNKENEKKCYPRAVSEMQAASDMRRPPLEVL
jgi:hypothetical protein